MKQLQSTHSESLKTLFSPLLSPPPLPLLFPSPLPLLLPVFLRSLPVHALFTGFVTGSWSQTAQKQALRNQTIATPIARSEHLHHSHNEGNEAPSDTVRILGSLVPQDDVSMGPLLPTHGVENPSEVQHWSLNVIYVQNDAECVYNMRKRQCRCRKEHGMLKPYTLRIGSKGRPVLAITLVPLPVLFFLLKPDI